MTTPEWQGIDDPSSLIQYSGNWQAFTNVNPTSVGWRDVTAGTYHSTTQTKSTFFLQFHGDGIDFWSHTNLGNNGQFILQLDGGAPETVTLNTAEPNPRLPIWQKSNLVLCDHEVIGVFVGGSGAETSSGGVGYIDAFAAHNTQYATDGFNLKSVGSAASSVPSAAIVVDNEDSTISYNGKWIHGNGVQYYQQTTASTTTPGDSLTFRFTGSAIWYFTNIDPGHAPVSISVDGGTPDIVQSTGPTGSAVSQRMIWSKQGLSNTLHTLTATHVGSTGQAVSLDFFRVLGFASAAPPPSSGNSGNSGSPTSNGPVSSGAQATSLGIAAITINGSGPATTSGTGTPQTVSGSLNQTSTAGLFPATIIITGTYTGTSSNLVQTTITVAGTQEQQQGQSNNIGVIIGAAFGAAAFIVFAVGCLFWYRRTSQLKQTSRIPSPLDFAELGDNSRLESAIYAKRAHFLASETPRTSSPAMRDMEERAGALEPESSSTALIPVRDAHSPQPSAPSSHSPRPALRESQLDMPLSPAPPPYER